MAREQKPRELLVVILDEEERLQDLLTSLYNVGVPGATVLNSVGGYTTHSWLEDIGLSGIARLFHQKEIEQRMVFAVMDSDLIDRAIAAAEEVVEGFGRPHSGFLFTLPVSHTVGLFKRPQPAPVTPPIVTDTDVQVRDMPIAQAAQLIESGQIVVPSNASLADIIKAMSKNPSTHVAAVVSRENHLIGLVTLRDLADRVFFGIMPELFFSEVSDRTRAEEFGKMSTDRSASDFMIDPVAVHMDDPVSEAFRLMHTNNLSGLPVVDDNNHVVEFVGLMELLELVLTREENQR